MIKTVKDRFDIEYETSKLEFYILNEEDLRDGIVAAFDGNYFVDKFTYEELELTEQEINKLEKDGRL